MFLLRSRITTSPSSKVHAEGKKTQLQEHNIENNFIANPWTLFYDLKLKCHTAGIKLLNISQLQLDVCLSCNLYLVELFFFSFFGNGVVKCDLDFCGKSGITDFASGNS